MLGAEDEMATIIVPDPTKCLMLQREHIKCTTIADLTINFTDLILNDLLKSRQPISCEEWQNGISHVLKIYQPTCLHVSSTYEMPENDDFTGNNIFKMPLYTVLGKKQDYTFFR